MTTNNPHKSNIYFLGIGGIGMSALARYFNAKGYSVSGYDRTSTTLTQALEKEGITIHYTENIERIPDSPEMIIYTPAIPADNKEYKHLLSTGKKLWKRAEVLGKLSSEYKTIGCAGTHGKTTTSTLVAHLLNESSLGCQAFLGGISRNYNTNLLLNDKSEFLVAEADEFDRSFLQLSPYIAIITSIDADHLDIYKTTSAVEDAFKQFSSKIKPGGTLLLKKGINLDVNLSIDVTLRTYSIKEEADYYVKNLKLETDLYTFDLYHPKGIIKNLTLGIPGLYNVENAVAALAAALECGTTENELREAIFTFKGVKRRFDIQFRSESTIYIDDYAHHPEEINACISSAKHLYPKRKITGIFQPHLYSRTSDFAEEFAKSLSQLDHIILLPIYPARELPLPGVSSEMLLNLIDNPNKELVEKSQIFNLLKHKELDILITMGAGDIDTLVDSITNLLKNK